MIPKEVERYIEKGWYILPLWGCREDGSCRCPEGEKCPNGMRGKHPIASLAPKGVHSATNDIKTVRYWFQKRPDAGVGLVTGQRNGFFVLDVDPRHGGWESLEKIERAYGPLPDTLRVKTGGGGKHFYFRLPKDRKIFSKQSALGAGLDVKGENSYVVAPPTRHTLGDRYEWENWETPIADPPQYLLDMLLSSDTATIALEGEIPEGERHNTLLHIAKQLAMSGISRQELQRRMKEIRDKRCQNASHPVDDKELNGIVEAAVRHALVHLPWNDIGNAQRFVLLQGEDVRHCYTTRTWYVWSQYYWKPDEAEAFRRLKETIEVLRSTPAHIEEEEKFRKFANGSGNRWRVEAAFSMAQTERYISVRPEDLDKDPFLLGCSNGVLDIRTRKLLSPDRNFLITRNTHIPYREDAKSPLWERFLEEACSGDKDQIKFLQIAAGYSLTGSTQEEKVFFIVGPAGTGKSTFVESLRAAMGDYATVVSANAFLASSREGGEPPRPQIAALPGVRLAISSEIPSGARLSSLFKSVGSGDVIRVRTLYSKPFEFKPQFKLWMTMNELPLVSSVRDTGVFRRVIVIEFKYKPPKPDPMLKWRLKTEEREAILAWAVEGARMWQEEGLQIPQRIQEATDDYRESQDPISDWLNESYEIGDGYVSATDVWESFQAYMHASGINPARVGVNSRKALAQILRERGFETELRWDPEAQKTHRMYKGLRKRKELY